MYEFLNSLANYSLSESKISDFARAYIAIFQQIHWRNNYSYLCKIVNFKLFLLNNYLPNNEIFFTIIFLKFRKPCCVTLPKGSITAAKLSSIFEIIEKAVTPVSSKKVTPSKMLREACIPNTRIFSKLQPPSKSTREEYGEALKVCNFDYR